MTEDKVMRRSRCPARVVAWSLPFLVLAALTVTYVVAPGFYTTHVLHINRREGQLVEQATFGCALLASLLLAAAAFRVGRRGERAGAALVAIVALAAFFFAGEEVSWGQSLFGWRTPEAYRAYAVETNLHNTDLPINQLGGFFLICVFFVLPFAWRWRARLRLPDGLAPAVAEGPVVLTMAVAFAWRFVKEIYRAFRGEVVAEGDRFYVRFLEQANEHKELLVAVGLLVYALYRLAWRHSSAPEISGVKPPAQRTAATSG